MRIIHTSDLHLCSPLSSKLPTAKQVKRGRELFETFERICRYAKDNQAEAILISGDLFDSTSASDRDINQIFSAIKHCPATKFFYVSGNHEGDLLLKNTVSLPCNLTVFGKGWSYCNIGDVTIAGRSDVDGNIFDDLSLDENRKNIVMLHGELRESGCGNEIINISDAKDKAIDYMALGHYHTYREAKIDRRGVAVYCGTPEGRGFDEVGELGFSEIIIGNTVSYGFVPFSKRIVRNIKADISSSFNESDVRDAIDKVISEASADDMIRITLSGERSPELRYDLNRLCSALKDSYFYLEIKDESKLYLNPDEYRYDKSLKGEFIRLCLSDDTLTDRQKDLIIRCGLSALAGEVFDGIE